MARFKRRYVQIISAIAGNSYFDGFKKGIIYRGKWKFICFPGLNCYSCPGAIASCPIGAIQAILNSFKYQISFYLLGSLMAVGTIGGRLVCGWICPFGLFQDLVYKMPIKKISMKKSFSLLKYFFLTVFVILMPAFLFDDLGLSLPYFCKYICPAGTLEAGIPLAISNLPIRKALGAMFHWKLFLLGILIIISMMISRPFCRAICPLGAIYSLFNPISFYSMEVDVQKCIKCDACKENCPVDIRIYQNPNDYDCIRCGECTKVCPTKAISSGFNFGKDSSNPNVSIN